ncbi:hypothetical protein DRF75_03755 [Ehrlichia minasensis]|uniref:Uncharacterized protein n=1 Tax=Ehrlichia minasensis TaxID=1242993 RepID=A0A4Q6I3S8_9RICK|nr:hypothetical protein [Ehrlichia minasensis]RZB12525.1 hypothetical protein DRF75_03755 [Ehrlichia minasensis]CEI85412.1 Uncharacterized protein ehr_00808 [Ehrlichia minasensis]
MIKTHNIAINFISAVMITAAATGLALCAIGVIREHQCGYCVLCTLLLVSAFVSLVANYKKGIGRKYSSVKEYLRTFSSDESLDTENRYYDPVPDVFAEHYFDEDVLSADRTHKIHVDRKAYYSEPYEDVELEQYSAYEEALYHNGLIRTQPFFAECETTPPSSSDVKMKTFSSGDDKVKKDTTIQDTQEKNYGRVQISDSRVDAVKSLSEEQSKSRS